MYALLPLRSSPGPASHILVDTSLPGCLRLPAHGVPVPSGGLGRLRGCSRVLWQCHPLAYPEDASARFAVAKADERFFPFSTSLLNGNFLSNHLLV
jgi:hypothetical protein